MTKKKSEGVGRSVEELKNAINPSPDVAYLRQRIQDLEAKHREQKHLTGEAMEIIHSLQEAIQSCKPVRMQYRAQDSIIGEAVTHVLHLTDLHYGGVIRADEIDGLNRR